MMRAPGLAAPRTKPPRSAAVAAGRTAMRALPATKWLFLMPLPRRGEAGTVSTAIAIRLLFGSVRPRAEKARGQAGWPFLAVALVNCVQKLDCSQRRDSGRHGAEMEGTEEQRPQPMQHRPGASGEGRQVCFVRARQTVRLCDAAGQLIPADGSGNRLLPVGAAVPGRDQRR